MKSWPNLPLFFTRFFIEYILEYVASLLPLGWPTLLKISGSVFGYKSYVSCGKYLLP